MDINYSTISFPGFGIGNFTVDSEAFSIFGRSIAWYALIIVCGMIASVIYTTLQAKKIGITFDDVIDFALFTIPIGVIGARLYYVLSELDQYDTFMDVIDITQGGLAIYGGIIAGGLTVLCVSIYKRINFLALADCVAPAVLLAQGIGRWGNFMNGEAFGAQTDWFCRMGLQNSNTAFTFGTSEMVYVHPCFLYESIWNLLGVLLVYLFGKFIHKKYDGQQFLMTFAWYGFGRAFIEGLRTDSLYFMKDLLGETIRVSQALGIAIFLVCAAFLVYFAIKKPNKEFYYKPAPVLDKKGKPVKVENGFVELWNKLKAWKSNHKFSKENEVKDQKNNRDRLSHYLSEDNNQKDN